MTNIHGIQPSLPSKGVDLVGAPGAASGPASTKRISDAVELSPIAQLAAKIGDIPEVRTALVEQVKAEIAAGTYETPERLEVAVSKLMEELSSGM